MREILFKAKRVDMPDGSRDTTRNAGARHSLALMYPLALIYLRFFVLL